MSSTASESREARAAEYRLVRQATIDLCRPLAVEDHVPQSMTTASPAKWHLAHTSWFFEEFILQHHLPAYRPFSSPLLLSVQLLLQRGG